MPAERERVGTVGCLICKQAIPVKRGQGGALSVCCPWCDLSAYAKRGTLAYRQIERIMKPIEPDDSGPIEPAPIAPKPREPEKVEAVAPKRKEPVKPARVEEDLPWISKGAAHA